MRPLSQTGFVAACSGSASRWLAAPLDMPLIGKHGRYGCRRQPAARGLFLNFYPRSARVQFSDDAPLGNRKDRGGGFERTREYFLVAHHHDAFGRLSQIVMDPQSTKCNQQQEEKRGRGRARDKAKLWPQNPACRCFPSRCLCWCWTLSASFKAFNLSKRSAAVIRRRCPLTNPPAA